MAVRSRSYGVHDARNRGCGNHIDLGVTARSRNHGVELLLHDLSAETDVPVAAPSRSYGVHMTRATAVAAIT